MAKITDEKVQAASAPPHFSPRSTNAVIRRMVCGAMLLFSLAACDKSDDSADSPTASPEITSARERPTAAPPAAAKPEAPEKQTAPAVTAARKRLEAKPYYNAENVAAAKALIAKVPPETHQQILEKMRQGKLIDAVKLIRAVDKTSIAVSRIAVGLMAISAGAVPGNP